MDSKLKLRLIACALFFASGLLMFLTTWLFHKAYGEAFALETAFLISAIYSSIVTVIDTIMVIVFLVIAKDA